MRKGVDQEQMHLRVGSRGRGKSMLRVGKDNGAANVLPGTSISTISLSPFGGIYDGSTRYLPSLKLDLRVLELRDGRYHLREDYRRSRVLRVRPEPCASKRCRVEEGRTLEPAIFPAAFHFLYWLAICDITILTLYSQNPRVKIGADFPSVPNDAVVLASIVDASKATSLTASSVVHIGRNTLKALAELAEMRAAILKRAALGCMGRYRASDPQEMTRFSSRRLVFEAYRRARRITSKLYMNDILIF
ncbi:hypothetical protein PENSPDRAFT_670202 [Peniophora sp. CONT]|nr:hypothetical protein PENSPDRAFT_670202 [Peniophora sp. CONT]